MPEFCKVDTNNHVFTITLNRPEKLNALHPPAHAELDQVLDQFAANSDLWIAVITGEGRAFCAGNDLHYHADSGLFSVPTHHGFAGITSRFDMDKPLIAAVNGLAMGGGFEIALACDLVIASETARFAMTEPKVGLAALAGGLQRLPREIGLKRAMGMILTGRQVSAEEGKELGFVNEVVAHDKLYETVNQWTNMILECAPLSIRASKDVVYRSLGIPSLEEAMSVRHDSVNRMLESDDFVEGPRAFAEKRKAQWKGQ